MIVESIRVRRYRAIEDAELQLGRLTYLVGRNGAGKSTFLNALGAFFGAVAVKGEADFYLGDQQAPIEITLTFTDLTAAAASEFQNYVRDDRLVVTRKFEWDGSRISDAFHGSTLQFPAFRAIRAAQGQGRIDAYRAIADDFALPPVRSAANVDTALVSFEAEHSAELDLIDDGGRFFGYRNVAVGKLDKYIDFVLVPAVRDFALDAGDGRDSALGRLVDIVVQRRAALSEPIAKLREELKEKYAAVLGDSRLSLDDLQARMTRSIKRFAPGTTIGLEWATLPEVTLPMPSPVATITDDGLAGDIASKGHGLQRAYLMAALHLLSETEATRLGAGEDGTAEQSPRGLLLAIEEPELYQHPAQARFIAGTLQELATMPEARISVLACTHSPVFVEVRSFDAIRRIQKSGPASSPRVVVSRATLDDVAGRLQAAHEPATPFTGEGLRHGLIALMNPYVNEALFADFVVLVEGEEDKALLEASLPRNQGWPDLRSQAFAVIPVAGKANLDKMLAILDTLDVPHYLVFDADGTKPSARANDERLNVVLGRLAGLSEPEPMPATSVDEHHAVFNPTISRVVADEIGPERWHEIRDAVCGELRIEVREGVVKNSEVVRKMLDRAEAAGLASPSLGTATNAIVAAARRGLSPEDGTDEHDEDAREDT